MKRSSSALLSALIVTLLCSGNSVQSSLAHTPEPSAQENLGAMLAPTPPMGWNSWDSFGTTVTEVDVRENALWMANHLRSYGWKYVVVDMEWFVENPTAEGNSKNALYSMDQFGRYTPDEHRFPSAANDAGFKPLSDYIHSLGLKFGIHILRGIPRTAVEKNLPIAGSQYRASDAADGSDTCPWNPDNYGTDAAKPAAQAYYDSIAQLYASWGVDLIKADCIASHPYKGDDIRMLSTALSETRRPIVLSLSPGEAPIEKLDELRAYSQMWRISDDVWDLWHSDVAYPQGVSDQFARTAKWVSVRQTGRWPDADMLPLGYLGPRPGWGKVARISRPTHEEQRTLFALWCIFRSPLMIGGNLPRSDPWTISLLSNKDLLAIDQHSTENRQVVASSDIVIWTARAAEGGAWYVAAFNRGEKLRAIQYQWKEIALPEQTYHVFDLWAHKSLGQERLLAARLPPHACIVYRLQHD